jgi:hypothetical protein
MRMVHYKSKFRFVVKGIFLKTKDTSFKEHGTVISGSLLDILSSEKVLKSTHSKPRDNLRRQQFYVASTLSLRAEESQEVRGTFTK